MERRILHLIRHPDGSIDATARGVTVHAAESWRKKPGTEIFAIEVELPFPIGTDVVLQGKVIETVNDTGPRT